MSGVLRVDVETLANSLGRAVNVMEALEQNIRPQKQESIGFTNINGMLSVFTPKRWILIETVRRQLLCPVSRQLSCPVNV